MKRMINRLLISGLILLTSCSPYVATSLEQNIPLTSMAESIQVFGLNSEMPADAEVLGTVKFGDTGFTVKDCTFHDALNYARVEAKKAGGNAIKITNHIPPGKSTCHRITAKILRLSDTKTGIYQEAGSQGRYAILNIFCEPDTAEIDYDLHLGDSVICSVNNKLKTTIAVREKGVNTIWAEVDKRSEIQINLEFGQTYFLKCGLLPEDTVKQPVIELVDPAAASRVFGIIRSGN